MRIPIIIFTRVVIPVVTTRWIAIVPDIVTLVKSLLGIIDEVVMIDLVSIRTGFDEDTVLYVI